MWAHADLAWTTQNPLLHWKKTGRGVTRLVLEPPGRLATARSPFYALLPLITTSFCDYTQVPCQHVQS